MKLESTAILESKDFGKYLDLRAFEKDPIPIGRALQERNLLENVRGVSAAQEMLGGGAEPRGQLPPQP